MDWTILTFDVAKVMAVIASVTIVVQAAKKAFEWLEAHADVYGWARKIWTWWAHSWGPRVLSALVAVVVVLAEVASDGALQLNELWQILQALGLGDLAQWAGVAGGSNVLFWVLRRWVFTKVDKASAKKPMPKPLSELGDFPRPLTD